MARLIDADELIERILDTCGTTCEDCPSARVYCETADMLDIIRETPTSPTNWTPITDRLPTAFRLVLISRHIGVLNYDSVSIAQRLESGQWYDMVSDMPVMGVTAWMELPEPYKEANT